MHTKFERLLSKSLTTLEVMAYYLVVHTGHGPVADVTNTKLRVDAAVETKLALKLIKTTGLCSAVHGKFLFVLDYLVTSTSTETLASKGTRNFVATLKQKLGKLVTTVSPLKS